MSRLGWLNQTGHDLRQCPSNVGLRGVLSPCQDASLKKAPQAAGELMRVGRWRAIRPDIARSVKASPWSATDLPDQGLFVRHSPLRHHASREFSDSDQRSRRASYQAKETLQCFSMAGVQISAFSFAQRQAHRSRTRVSGLR